MQWLRAGAPQREFERFVAEWTDPLLRTAYLMARDLAEAEDLVQETLLRVARRWPRVRAMDHPAAYARRILSTCDPADRVRLPPGERAVGRCWRGAIRMAPSSKVVLDIG